LQCGQCGDWNALDEIDGHLASEGRQTEAKRVLDALETFDRLVPPPAVPGLPEAALLVLRMEDEGRLEDNSGTGALEDLRAALAETPGDEK
jgi:hypothetical protein